MNYYSAIAYLDSLVNYERLPNQGGIRERRLERMRALLDALGNPQERFRIIHVAGTKGKGSVCAMLHAVLRQCEVPAGLYTSPHLDSVRERIRIEADISEPHFAEGVQRVQQAIEQTTPAGGPVTYFEALTALAFDYFARQQVRWAVVEVGLGGRLDATNVAQPPLAILTPISLDHTDVLGSTVTSIAREKSCIIKSGQIVVSAPQTPAARAIIAQRCAEQGAQLIEYGTEVVITSMRLTREGSTCSMRGSDQDYPDVRVPLLGRHQMENAATAVAALEALQRLDPQIGLTAQRVRDGLASVVWPGRAELLPTVPALLLDGAHNRASAARLRELLTELFPRARIALIIGTSQGKDMEGMARELGPLAAHAWAVAASHPRAMAADEVAAHLHPWVPQVRVVQQLADALLQAQQAACDLIVVTGSLFLVAAAREHVAAFAR